MGLLARLRSAAARDEGFSIIELVVAITVLAIVMAATAGGVTTALGLARTNRARTVAANVATQQMELERTLPFQQHVEGVQAPATVMVAGVPYTVEVTKNWAAQDSTTGICDVASATGSLAYLNVDVRVSWPEQGSTPPVRSTTVIAPPNASYSPYLGHLVVKVFDRSGQPSDHRVTVSGGPTSVNPQDTGADGCAIFPFLRPGTYTVSVNTLGHVSSSFLGGQFLPAPSQQSIVAANTTRPIEFEYDEAGYLDLRLQGRSGGDRPADVPITLRNTRLLQPTGSYSVAASQDTVFPVFPESTGYEVYAGDASCDDHRPDPRLTLDPAPGESSAPQQLLATLVVRVEDSSATPIRNSTGTIRARNTNCPAATYDVVTQTDGNGDARVALPYGTYTLELPSVPSASDAVTLGPQQAQYQGTLRVQS